MAEATLATPVTTPLIIMTNLIDITLVFVLLQTLTGSHLSWGVSGIIISIFMIHSGKNAYSQPYYMEGNGRMM